MKFEEAWELVEPIPSFVQQPEAKALWDLASKRQGQLAVDIGGARGRSAILFALAGMNVITVSNWNDPGEGTEAELRANLTRCGVEVEVVRGDSYDVGAARTDLQIGLLFIDGGHDERIVRGDVNAWSGKVVNGGIMAFHDYGTSVWLGVNKVVDEIREFCSTEWVVVGQAIYMIAFVRRLREV